MRISATLLIHLHDQPKKETREAEMPMKRALQYSALTVIVSLCALLAAQQPQPSRPLPPSVKITPRVPGSTPAAAATPAPQVDNSKPEPSALYGYVTVVDPNTGQHYVADPRATASQRGSGLTFPIHVVFRGTNNPSQTFTRDWPQGTAYYRNPPAAVWYSIPLMQDSAAGDYPVVNYRDFKLHYDPAKWRFLRLEMGPVGWQEMSDTGVTTNVSVPVNPVAPIADFPDFGGSISGPGR
jgi:hypothetical protein